MISAPSRPPTHQFEESVEDQIGRHPGLVGRPKIFLSGGAPFGDLCLTDLEAMVDEAQPQVTFSVEKLHKLNEALRRRGIIPQPNPDKVPEQLRERARELIDDVRIRPRL